MKEEKIKIIYILGYGHSGSTLLNLITGTSSNAFSGGELIDFENKKKYLEKKDTSSKVYCDCGDKINQCTFWRDIFKKYQNVYLFSKSTMKNYFYNFLYIFLNIKFKNIYEKQENYELFRDILKKSKKNIVIDSSKNLDRLIHLNNDKRIDLKVLYLTRDGRAVINSMEKGNTFWLKTFIIWLANNILMKKFVKKLPQKDKLEISYDKFAQNPEKYLKQINEKFGTKIDLKNYINDVNNTQYHNFSGNSMRNKKLESIKYDQSWKKRMSKPKQILLTILCYIPNKLWVYNKK